MQVHEVDAGDVELVSLVRAQVDELSMRYDGVPDHGFAQPPLDPTTTWVLVRDDEGTAVACGAVQPLTHTVPGAPADGGEVKRVYVLPSHRGRGLSRLVMRELHDRAYARGFRSLQLETGTAQPEALALYTSLGYTPIEPYGYYKDSPRTRCFRRDLSAADVVPPAEGTPSAVGTVRPPGS